MPHRLLYIVKTKFLVISWGVLTALFSLINKYFFDDWQFLAFLSVAIVADTALGVAIAWDNHELNFSRGFKKVFIKMIIYGAFLVFTHVVVSYTVHGVRNTFFYWFTSMGYAALIVSEGGSIMRNINILKPGTMPAWLMKRFAEFNDKGEQIKK